MIVVEESSGFVRPLRFHVDQGCRLIQGALSANNQAIPVIGSSICHVISFRAAYLVAREIRWGEEFDFCNDDGFVGCGDSVRGVIGDLVGGHEQGVRFGDEDTRFMKIGGARVRDEER